jgi:hypothetical protein
LVAIRHHPPGKQLQVAFSDGSAFELHGLWLRDACRDDHVVSSQAGERFLDRRLGDAGWRVI